jgi:hypothetical protein
MTKQLCQPHDLLTCKQQQACQAGIHRASLVSTACWHSDGHIGQLPLCPCQSPTLARHYARAWASKPTAPWCPICCHSSSADKSRHNLSHPATVHCHGPNVTPCTCNGAKVVQTTRHASLHPQPLANTSLHPITTNNSACCQLPVAAQEHMFR